MAQEGGEEGTSTTTAFITDLDALSGFPGLTNKDSPNESYFRVRDQVLDLYVEETDRRTNLVTLNGGRNDRATTEMDLEEDKRPDVEINNNATKTPAAGATAAQAPVPSPTNGKGSRRGSAERPPIPDAGGVHKPVGVAVRTEVAALRLSQGESTPISPSPDGGLAEAPVEASAALASYGNGIVRVDLSREPSVRVHGNVKGGTHSAVQEEEGEHQTTTTTKKKRKRDDQPAPPPPPPPSHAPGPIHKTPVTPPPPPPLVVKSSRQQTLDLSMFKAKPGGATAAAAAASRPLSSSSVLNSKVLARTGGVGSKAARRRGGAGAGGGKSIHLDEDSEDVDSDDEDRANSDNEFGKGTLTLSEYHDPRREKMMEDAWDARLSSNVEEVAKDKDFIVSDHTSDEEEEEEDGGGGGSDDDDSDAGDNYAAGSDSSSEEEEESDSDEESDDSSDDDSGKKKKKKGNHKKKKDSSSKKEKRRQEKAAAKKLAKLIKPIKKNFKRACKKLKKSFKKQLKASAATIGTTAGEGSAAADGGVVVARGKQEVKKKFKVEMQALKDKSRGEIAALKKKHKRKMEAAAEKAKKKEKPAKKMKKKHHHSSDDDDDDVSEVEVDVQEIKGSSSEEEEGGAGAAATTDTSVVVIANSGRVTRTAGVLQINMERHMAVLPKNDARIISAQSKMSVEEQRLVNTPDNVLWQEPQQYLTAFVLLMCEAYVVVRRTLENGGQRECTFWDSVERMRRQFAAVNDCFRNLTELATTMAQKWLAELAAARMAIRDPPSRIGTRHRDITRLVLEWMPCIRAVEMVQASVVVPLYNPRSKSGAAAAAQTCSIWNTSQPVTHHLVMRVSLTKQQVKILQEQPVAAPDAAPKPTTYHFDDSQYGEDGTCLITVFFGDQISAGAFLRIAQWMSPMATCYNIFNGTPPLAKRRASADNIARNIAPAGELKEVHIANHPPKVALKCMEMVAHCINASRALITLASAPGPTAAPTPVAVAAAVVAAVNDVPHPAPTIVLVEMDLEEKTQQAPLPSPAAPAAPIQDDEEEEKVVAPLVKTSNNDDSNDSDASDDTVDPKTPAALPTTPAPAPAPAPTPLPVAAVVPAPVKTSLTYSYPSDDDDDDDDDEEAEQGPPAPANFDSIPWN